MRTLIAGIGALGGTMATRAVSAGVPVWLATRTAESARALRSSGLRVSGIGGAAVASGIQVAALEEDRGESFDLVVLATKAHDALEIAPLLSTLLTPGGTLLCIQNGGVSQILSDRLGSGVVLGGLSNLGATMVEPGIYEQRNAGHLLIGELSRAAPGLASSHSSRPDGSNRRLTGSSLLLVVLREPSAEIRPLWGAPHPAREARARRPEEGGSTRPPFVEPGSSQPVLTSQLYDQLPKGAIALHQGVRLPHVAEVEGAHAERWNSPCRDSFGDCSQRRAGER